MVTFLRIAPSNYHKNGIKRFAWTGTHEGVCGVNYEFWSWKREQLQGGQMFPYTILNKKMF